MRRRCLVAMLAWAASAHAQPLTFTPSQSLTAPVASGTVIGSISGGTPPYSITGGGNAGDFLIDSSNNLDAAQELAAGNYQVQISDSAVSIGNCYNGLNNAVPPPTGGVVDLTGFGYAHCNLTVSNATIIDPFPDAQLIVAGNGNTIEMSSTIGSYLGYQAHKQIEVNGNGNIIDPIDGHANGNVVVNGVGNSIWGGGFVQESQHGNTIIGPSDGGFYWRWSGGMQGQSAFDALGPDTFNLIPVLKANGCSFTTNDPACASSDAAYDSFAPNNAGAPGVHNYCVTNAGCKAANPFEMWVDCTHQSDTISAFLSNPNVITGGTAPTKPPTPTTPTFSWPNGIPSTLGPENVSFLGPMYYTVAAYNSGGAVGLGGSFIDIFDPWAYANSGTDTVTISAANGTFLHVGESTSCGKGCNRIVNKPPAEMHELLVGVSYVPNTNTQTSDTITVTLSNSDSSSYTVTFPMTIQQGAICP